MTSPSSGETTVMSYIVFRVRTSRRVNGASETWMAFVSPQMPQRGEWRDHTPLTTSQVAATLVRWAGFDWKAFDPAAAPPVQDPLHP